MDSKDWDTLVDEEIEDELKHLRTMDVGTVEYKTTVEGVAKLMEKAMEKKKLEIEQKRSKDSHEFEKTLKLKQMKIDWIDRMLKHILTFASISVGVIVTVWGTIKSLRFEETGTVTTTAGRKYTGKLFSWLK